MTSTFGMIATIGYALAAVFALLAVAYYFLRHVRAVRDELTGRTAQREIADMRAGRRGHTWLGSASSAAVDTGAVSISTNHEKSGSLHVRNVEASTNVVVPTADVRSEQGTTLLGVTASDSAATEAGTTLLGASKSTETGTTLLGVSEEATVPAETSETSTTLLSSESEAKK